MALLFLLLAAVAAALIGDALLENTAQGEVTLANQTFTGLSLGEALALSAAVGFLLAWFLFLAFGFSSARRARRREQRVTQKEMEGRIAELERENASLHERLGTSGVPAAGTAGAAAPGPPEPLAFERTSVSAGQPGGAAPGPGKPQEPVTRGNAREGPQTGPRRLMDRLTHRGERSAPREPERRQP